MATYEYICLGCEHRFEERRPMGAETVDTALACPACGGDRVRRRFSVFASGSATTEDFAGPPPSTGGGGCCGGGCACGG